MFKLFLVINSQDYKFLVTLQHMYIYYKGHFKKKILHRVSNGDIYVLKHYIQSSKSVFWVSFVKEGKLWSYYVSSVVWFWKLWVGTHNFDEPPTFPWNLAILKSVLESWVGRSTHYVRLPTLPNPKQIFQSFPSSNKLTQKTDFDEYLL